MEPVHVHVPYHALTEYFDFIRNGRYDLEIYVSANVLDQLKKSDVESFAERLDWNPALTLHAPFLDMNPGSVDSLVRSATQTRFRQLLDVAEVLRPRVAVFHAAYDTWRYNGQQDTWLENSVETWRTVMDAASTISLRVAVENVCEENPDAIRILIEKVDCADFGFCFDTGHFNLFSKVTMEQWFESLGSHLVEVHLHDNDGTGDSHWAPGRGTVNFDKFFTLMSKRASLPVLTIEAHHKDDVETSLQMVKMLTIKKKRSADS
ncbi:MAG TPA: sugar phosphate isomerase/epimerase family protein [Nitrospirota bacterium]|nr:sugar phosphate isomerase/epimerase family protein [Nitrospirota bacterium]